MNNWTEKPVDALVLGIHYLQNYYNAERIRGMAGVGQYNLKSEFVHATIPVDELVIPDKIVNPDDIIALIKGKSEHKS